MSAIKAKKIPGIAFSLFLTLTIIFGIITHISFGQSCIDETKYNSASISRNTDYGTLMNAEDVLLQLKDAPYILVVHKVASEEKFECMKSRVVIKQVIRGESLYEQDEIFIYEYNNFSTYQNQGEQLYYINRNPANLMNDTDDYLVFLYKMELNSAYEKYNPTPEFAQYGGLEMISLFNISKNIQSNYSDAAMALNMNYSDIKDMEFLCFSQESLQNLNKIKLGAIDIAKLYDDAL